MTPYLTRRGFASALLGSAVFGAALHRSERASAGEARISEATTTAARRALAAVEAKNGGRLGVVAFDTASGAVIAHRPDERFAMCSTHKLISAAVVLHLVDAGRTTLERRLPFGDADLMDYAPIAKKNLAAGFMTLETACMAALAWSDNTAANLLLDVIGGPSGWTTYARSLGDETTRLDRIEPGLNAAVPGDPRDTTTPQAMARDVGRLLLGDALSAPSRRRLTDWMLDSPITGGLLRAGLPRDWRVADKSGSGDNGTRNDVGLVLPPAGAPIVAAVYYTESPLKGAARDPVIAEVGAIIRQAFAV